VVAVVIFSDNGQAFIMGKDKSTACDCILKGINGRKISYVPDEGERLKYLDRAIGLMNGTIKE
jgi:hypothetical protein